MESADKNFCRAMDYLIAAQRLDTAGKGHEALERLSAEYRARAHELIGMRVGCEPTRPVRSPSGGLL